MKTKSFDRDSRKRQVVLQFAVWVQREQSEVWATSYRIARALKLEGSSHFRSILNEMVDEGYLITRQANKSGRWSGLEYMLAPGTYTPPKKRTIAINPRKHDGFQMELF